MHIKVLLWCPLLYIKLKNWARSIKVYVDTDIISDHESLYFNEEALWRATPTYIIIYYRDSDFYKSLLYTLKVTLISAEIQSLFIKFL